MTRNICDFNILTLNLQKNDGETSQADHNPLKMPTTNDGETSGAFIRINNR